MKQTGFAAKKDTATKAMLDSIDWKLIDEQPVGEIPHVTHEAFWNVCEGVSIRVVQLSNGQRIIPEDELSKIFAFGREN